MKTSLKKQLEYAIAQADMWEAKYWEARNKLDKFEQAEKDVLRKNINNHERVGQELLDMNRQMMEIVRWHINPETAKKEPPQFDKYGNPLT